LRQISTKTIIPQIAELTQNTATYLRPDIELFYKKIYKNLKNPKEKLFLGKLLENAKLAKKNQIPYCQDTGQAIIFCEIGQDVHITDGDLEKAIQKGVKIGSKNGNLRQSIVADPLIRKNTKTNTPVIVHYKIVKGQKLKFSLLCKGFGSENKGKVAMLNPTASIDDIKNFVLSVIKEAGANACPPFFIGIGLGGTMDLATTMAKEALLKKINKKNPKKHLAKLENDLLKAANNTGLGVLGFGGDFTVITVKIKESACHIAGLPVAVNIGCHAVRTGEIII
jgi:fumarate hydratase subunit alpha